MNFSHGYMITVITVITVRKTLRNFLNFYIMILELILYHHVQTACPGKFWSLSYGLKGSWPIISLDYLFRIFCLMLNHYTQTACSGKLWFSSYIWPHIVAWKVRNYVVFTYFILYYIYIYVYTFYIFAYILLHSF